LYRQVLTSVDKFQHLLRLPIFNKTRLDTFYLKCKKENYSNWFLPEREKQVFTTLIYCAPLANNDHC